MSKIFFKVTSIKMTSIYLLVNLCCLLVIFISYGLQHNKSRVEGQQNKFWFAVLFIVASFKFNCTLFKMQILCRSGNHCNPCLV